MAYSQKYSLVSFINPIAVSTEFNMADWPLHVTLADVFAIDRAGTDIDAKLAAMIDAQTSFLATADKEATLRTTPVVTLHQSPDLLGLHCRIVDLLEANGAVFNTPEFNRKGFIPHCTIQKAGRLYAGDTLHIETVAFVDMFPDGDWQQRKILQSFELT